ncbi:hypothetical protein SDC9_179370 [bioreactor metagenome]|uniref:Uncharacterized protein n=1 Tax=bioreactor metagenome TaxID=1076179 RepID=A0A645GYK4_9ZZZZ
MHEHGFEIQTRLSDSGRCACLEPADREAFGPQGRTQTDRSGFTQTSRRRIVFTDENPCLHESAGGEHNRLCADTMASFGHHTAHNTSIFFCKDIGDGILKQCQTMLRLEGLLGIAVVGELVGLGSRGLHGRTAMTVQDAVLDHGLVDQMSHLAAEGIDLPHEIPFRESTHGRIARQPADGI